MTRPPLVVDMPGTPIPQGSMRSFVRGGRAIVTSDNPNLRSWRLDVAAAAQEALGLGAPFLGAVKVEAMFSLPRPKSHLRTDGTLRPSAASWPIGRPDLDKLQRALGDALTAAGIWNDDSQVVQWDVEKTYPTIGRSPGLLCVVTEA